VGVAPDVNKPADQALEVAYRMAAEKVMESTKDPRQKEQLKKLLDEKKSNGN
jgi:hypothetical protein